MLIQTPDWVKHAVFYQIYPDAFARSIPSHQQWLLDIPLENWDASPTYQGYKGGNLWGVIDKLDYLQDLGVTALYFTPIFRSASNHRYHTHDYYQIDPLLGGNKAFDILLKTAHERGFKVVLDGVFNHASRGFFFFNDILENGPNSPWLDWFKIEGWPLSAYDGSLPANYVSWIDYRALPQFNHDNPAVREYIMQVGEYWLKQGIDGWRLDVPDCIKTPGFWQEFRQRVKAINPDAYIVGEIAFDATQWLDGKQFDGVMNYPFGRATIAFIVGDRLDKTAVPGFYKPYPALDAADYATEINQLLKRHPWEIQLTQLNLLDSHDTARLITMAGGDHNLVKLATLLLFTFPGTPNIFYGDEIGLEGSHDPDCRYGFPSPENWNQEVLSYHRKLIQLRQKYTALRTGEYHTLYAQGNIYSFARILDNQIFIIALNKGEKANNIKVTEFENCQSILALQPSQVVYGEGTIEWGQDYLSLTIPSRSGLIITIN
ncbi:glycoside hydrolase family 13 protein [Crocosphaera sp. UHCC 0190]|uniref:glycoside hydrolase family 13 protein n=1 Tax=Crocosphaera sp. UHCC 0190 TaxID=3110246 RepID=UPI002B203206|nr:glycoside hydrolase family 13 protein [Crocosphaera sp. UHCC 0190]MEA5510598.1 glycoside hydrolase family 13 protein [Crocosphaera sp. UHCC 0190]